MAGRVRKAMREQNMLRALHGLSASISKDRIALHRLSSVSTSTAIRPAVRLEVKFMYM